jgi:hypothetical protein
MDRLLTNDILDGLSDIGDPLVDTEVSAKLDQAERELWMHGARKQGLARFMDHKWLEEHGSDFGLGGLHDVGELPDPRRVQIACDLFGRYGSEIAAALLLAALPEAYAAGRGAKTLLRRSALAAGGQVSTRRIQATAQFVIWVMTPGPVDPPVNEEKRKKFTTDSFDATTALWGVPEFAKVEPFGPTKGRARCAALALRFMHSLIRNVDEPRPRGPKEDLHTKPINQEDLLATLLSFTVTVLEVLELFGICWSEEEQDAYFYVWNHVGKLLGIGDEHVIKKLTGLTVPDLRKKLREVDEGNPEDGLPEFLKEDKNSHNRTVMRQVADAGTLRPQSVGEGRALLALLRQRLWTLTKDRPPKPHPLEYKYETFSEVLDDVRAGRILLRALLDEVAAQLPASQKTWPVAVVRQLVPGEVQDRLALGSTSSVGLLSTGLSRSAAVPGALAARRVSEEALRQRATEVADALFLHYYDQGQLVIPGLDSAALGYGVRSNGPA